jgi:cysteine sulfinate desulfinase/cysteine desulfurase-like protein
MKFLRDSHRWIATSPTAINAPRAIAESTIRVTFGPENTAADVDAILAALRQLLKRK